VTIKLVLINTHIRPVLEYGMEVWGPSTGAAEADLFAPLQAVLDKACRMACGVRATPTEHAWERRAAVKHNVLMSDMHVLPAADAGAVAHVRYSERVRLADVAAVEVWSAEESPAADDAPDMLGAAVRAALPTGNDWRERLHRLDSVFQQARSASARGLATSRLGAVGGANAAGAPAVHASNAALSGAVRAARGAAWAAQSGSAPKHLQQSQRGRALRRRAEGAPHFNPVNEVLAGGTRLPSYLAAPDSVVLPLMALRSAHLLGDHTAEAAALYGADLCPRCGCDVVMTGEDVTADDRACHGCMLRAARP
jgi:hypothetical protein